MTSLRGSMKKKIVVLGVSLVVIVAGAFVYVNKLESKIEDSIRAQITQLPVVIEKINYSLLSNSLYLDNVSSEIKDGTSVVTLNIANLTVTDFNPEFSDEKVDLPTLFDELFVSDFSFVLKDAHAAEVKLTVDSINVFDYAHNFAKILEEYKKDVASEAFFKALLNYKHGGIEIEGYTLTGEIEGEKSTSFLKVKRVEIDEVNDPQITSFHYEDIQSESDGVSFGSEHLRVKNLQIPDAKRISNVMKVVLNALVSSGGRSVGSPRFYDELLESMSSDLDKDAVYPFSSISLEKVKIIPPYALFTNIAKIEKEEITFDIFSINVKSDETITVEQNIENFRISSEYLEIFDKALYKTAQAFLLEDMLINTSSVSVADPQTKMARSDMSFSLSDLFSASMSAVYHYTGEDFVRVALDYSGKDQDGLAFKELEFGYSDQGFLPLLAHIASSLTGIPVESFAPLAKQQLELIAEKSKTEDQKRAKMTEDILAATVAMLEKPGSMTAKIIFDELITLEEMENVGATDPLLLEVSIKTEQGDKSLSELIAETLKSEK